MIEFFDGRISNERKRNIGVNINYIIFNFISYVRLIYFIFEILFVNFLYIVIN